MATSLAAAVLLFVATALAEGDASGGGAMPPAQSGQSGMRDVG